MKMVYLFVLLLAGCGYKSADGPSSSGEAGSAAVSSTAPKILLLQYFDNGTFVKIEYPHAQVSNYEIAFCSDPQFNSCPKAINIQCTSAISCTKSAGQTGVIAIGNGSSLDRYALNYNYSPQGLSYFIRVRASNSEGQSDWKTAPNCTLSVPSTCTSN